MRIAMIGSRGIPARSGGIERVVEELTVELSARGHEVLVYGRRHYVGPRPRPPAGRLLVTAGLGGKHLDAITHTATALLDLPRRRADLVHLHSPGPALLSWMPALARIPIVLTIHAPDWARDKWSGPARAMLRAGLACGMKLARVVTAVSPSLARELSERYGRAVACVPNAVRVRPPRPAQRILAWGLRPEEFGLYVGRIEPEKRLHQLLEAWKTAGGGLPLVIAGDWKETSYGRHCRRSAPPEALFLGPRSGPLLEELYSNAAVVVQPSALEGMSLVLLEAAAYGRCAVASDIQANLDTLGGYALYFKCESITELAAQIRRSLANRGLRESTGRGARSHVARMFSWSAAASRMEELYRQAILPLGGGGDDQHSAHGSG